MKYTCKLCGKEGRLSFTEIYCATKKCRNYRESVDKEINKSSNLELDIEELEEQLGPFYADYYHNYGSLDND